MNPHDPRFSDSAENGDTSAAQAPEETQLAISDLLRGAAQHDHSTQARMPAEVEAKILAAFKAENLDLRHASTPSADESSSAHSSSGPSTMIPLPSGQRKPTAPTPVVPPKVDDDAPPTVTEGHSQKSTPVTSLAEHRQRRRGISRTALSLGAAAAVALGTLGIWQGTGGNSTKDQTPTAMLSSAQPAIRVTNSNTAYTTDSFTTQAEELSAQKSPAISSSAQAQQLGLGPLATRRGLETCVSAIDAVRKGNPDKIYADFGTYNNEPSVIVVVVKDGKKTAWAVNRTCTKESDARTSPRSLTT